VTFISQGDSSQDTQKALQINYERSTRKMNYLLVGDSYFCKMSHIENKRTIQKEY